MKLESIRKETLSSQAKEKLKLYFVRNRLKAGDAIPTEAVLASGLHISRTAVREALKSLESLGIIEVRPGVGRFLRPFSFDAIMEDLSYGIAMSVADFRDILEVRIALESAFLERCVGQLDAEQVAELREIVASMRRLAANGAPEAAMIEVHTQFHLALYRSQGNALLQSLIRFFATIQRSMTLVNRYRTENIAQFVDMHAALVDAVVSGDVQEARRRLLAHFEEAVQWSRQAVESAGDHPARPRQSGNHTGARP